MIVALATLARLTSDSVIPPTPRCTKASFTSSRSSLRSDSVSASNETLYIGLEHQVEGRDLAALDVGEDVLPAWCRRCTPSLHRLTGQAAAPAPGLGHPPGRSGRQGRPAARHRRRETSSKPSTWTGHRRGRPRPTWLPNSSSMARNPAPGVTGHHRIADPQRAPAPPTRWPPGPRPESRLASSTRPRTGAFGLARRSSHVGHEQDRLEEVRRHRDLPGPRPRPSSSRRPHSSGTSSCSVSWRRTPVGVGVLPVDLVDGHDDRDFRPSERGFSASIVWGMTTVVGRHHQHHDVRWASAPPGPPWR